jgi:hypothetical protein
MVISDPCVVEPCIGDNGVFRLPSFNSNLASNLFHTGRLTLVVLLASSVPQNSQNGRLRWFVLQLDEMLGQSTHHTCPLSKASAMFQSL